jgi:hypothetical protein
MVLAFAKMNDNHSIKSLDIFVDFLNQLKHGGLELVIFWTSISYVRECVVIPIGAETGYRSTFCCRGDWNARSRYAICFGIRMC